MLANRIARPESGALGSAPLGKNRVWHNVFGYGALLIVAAALMLPLYWMVSTAVKSPAQMFEIPPAWIPNPVDFSSFPRSFKRCRSAAFW